MNRPPASEGVPVHTGRSITRAISGRGSAFSWTEVYIREAQVHQLPGVVSQPMETFGGRLVRSTPAIFGFQQYQGFPGREAS